jgi:Ca2+-binding RTX toxin-like protein
LPIVGTDGPDILYGPNPAADWLSGLGGNDTLTSLNEDTLEGGAGDDLLRTQGANALDGWAT